MGWFFSARCSRRKPHCYSSRDRCQRPRTIEMSPIGHVSDFEVDLTEIDPVRLQDFLIRPKKGELFAVKLKPPPPPPLRTENGDLSNKRMKK